jgi:hypothetical protein
MNGGEAALALEPNPASGPSFSADRRAPLPKRGEVPQKRAPADPKLLRELSDGRGLASPE